MADQDDTDNASRPLLPTYTDDPSTNPNSFRTTYRSFRRRTQAFLNSRYQHYIVLTLVTLDVLSIFADIFLALYICEDLSKSPSSGEKPSRSKIHQLESARDGLSIAGLVFSCGFMLELLLSIWAFGWRYFNSWFHCLDATVIVASFAIDVLLKGVLEEAAQLVVILRLWRFFKIIEEFSVGAQEQTEGLQEEIERLEEENRGLKERLKGLEGADVEADDARGLAQMEDWNAEA